jgi:hypothetical protein
VLFTVTFSACDARAKPGEAFVAALLPDFLMDRKEAIERVRQEKPDQYLKVIASLLPRGINLSTAPSNENQTDDELLARFN